MTLKQIEKALRTGKAVYWVNTGYQVKMPNNGNIQEAYIEYLPTGWACGLTNNKTLKLIDNPKDFFISKDYWIEYLAK
jgi:hypothetical protein